MTRNAKPKIAFFDFTGCEGCQLTVIDSLQNHLDLLDAVEIVQFREAISEKSDSYQIAFVEGSCSRLEDEERLAAIRETAQLVIALGACAHLGGVNALRNWQSQDVVRKKVYGGMAKRYPAYLVKPTSAVIQVDGVIPGCPIDPEEFIRVVRELVNGIPSQLPEYPVCVECKLSENHCVFLEGIFCLGPVIRAGCGAICPRYGHNCEGCRGRLPDSNIDGLLFAISEHGLKKDSLDEILKTFQTYQLQKERG